MGGGSVSWEMNSAVSEDVLGQLQTGRIYRFIAAAVFKLASQLQYVFVF